MFNTEIVTPKKTDQITIQIVSIVFIFNFVNNLRKTSEIAPLQFTMSTLKNSNVFQTHSND